MRKPRTTYITRPLDKMSTDQLSDTIYSMINKWPCRLNKNEKQSLFNVMYDSVQSMRTRCMTQEQREKAIAAKKKANDEKMAQAAELARPQKKTHVIFV